MVDLDGLARLRELIFERRRERLRRNTDPVNVVDRVVPNPPGAVINQVNEIVPIGNDQLVDVPQDGGRGRVRRRVIRRHHPYHAPPPNHRLPIDYAPPPRPPFRNRLIPRDPVQQENMNAVMKSVMETVPHIDPAWLRAHMEQTGTVDAEGIINQIFDGTVHPREKLEDTFLEEPDTLEEVVPSRSINEIEVDCMIGILEERVKNKLLVQLQRPRSSNVSDGDFFSLMFNAVRMDVVRSVVGSFVHEMDVLIVLSILQRDKMNGSSRILKLLEDLDFQTLKRSLKQNPLKNARPNKNRIRPMDICPEHYKKYMQEIQQICAKATGTVKFECGVCFEEQEEKNAIVCEILEEKDDKKAYDRQHQFCVDCVSSYAESSLSQPSVVPGGIGLKCMHSGCEGVIKHAKVVRTLDNRVRKLFDHHIQMEALRSAGMELETCKNCTFAVEMQSSPLIDKVFNCLKCKSTYCRLCQRDWRVHNGRRCDEMEGEEETEEERMRKHLEEQLARVTVRYCNTCNIPFEKEIGCNKMTCRCGRLQCYQCRKPIDQEGYNHFCDHHQNRNSICGGDCGKCSMYADTAKNDYEKRKKIVESYRGKLDDEVLDGML